MKIDIVTHIITLLKKIKSFAHHTQQLKSDERHQDGFKKKKVGNLATH